MKAEHNARNVFGQRFRMFILRTVTDTSDIIRFYILVFSLFPLFSCWFREGN